MNINHIKQALSQYSDTENLFKAFSVLIPLIEGDNGLEVLFEVRSPALRSQPNEVCFPGGRIENAESPIECAIRETHEEILISPEQIEIIAELQPLLTPFYYKLHPVVGVLNHYDPQSHPYNTDEVESLFTVPLAFFLDHEPEIHQLESKLLPSEVFPYHKIQNGDAYNWKTATYEVLFYDYNGQVIWGLTAKMLHQFIKALR